MRLAESIYSRPEDVSMVTLNKAQSASSVSVSSVHCKCSTDWTSIPVAWGQCLVVSVVMRSLGDSSALGWCCLGAWRWRVVVRWAQDILLRSLCDMVTWHSSIIDVCMVYFSPGNSQAIVHIPCVELWSLMQLHCSYNGVYRSAMLTHTGL